MRYLILVLISIGNPPHVNNIWPYKDQIGNQAESRIDEEKLHLLSRFQINLLLFRALYGKYFLKINLTSKDQIAIV